MQTQPRGKRWRTVDVILVLVGVLIGLGVVGFVVKRAVWPARANIADAPVWERMAWDLGNFAQRYEAAENDIQRSDAFRAAREYDRAFKGHYPQLTEWRGRVRSIRTSHGGNTLTLTVVVGDEFPVALTQHGIPASDSVYAAARGLDRGACVTFSAYLDKETSLTERGAMRRPEYGVRFITLRGCQ